MKSTSKMVLKGNYYYKFICLWNNETKRKKQIPIKLAHKSDYDLAHKRKQIVEARANQLKQDKQLHLIIGYRFKWQSDSGMEEVAKPLTLDEGIDLYISNIVKLRRKSTIDININSLNLWSSFLNNNSTMICSQITTKHLMDFVIEMKGRLSDKNERLRADTTINMDLRILRTFLYYLRDVESLKLDKNLSFKRALKECPINDEEPIYITEIEFNQIMEEEWCRIYSHDRNFYKEVFKMFWDLGLRLSEPFKGVIQGNYLHIPSDVAKNGMKRDVHLTTSQIDLIRRIQQKWNESGRTKDSIRTYSKMFKKALRHCEIDEDKHFHCLRHSFALRRRLESNGNVEMVRKEMGHKNINTTMKYLRCDEKKLKYDFPSFKNVLESLENGRKKPTSTIDTSTNYNQSLQFDGREIN